jgi:protein-L-isoaspartate(D-aspartate) O-methyltransferase
MTPNHRIAVRLIVWLAVAGVAVTEVAAAQTAAEYEQARRHMVDVYVVGAGVKNPRVIKVMRETPRHEFMPAKVRSQAYFDMGVPIGEAQTISSPFIVAYMTECLDPQPTDKVLEIGTGSGYQAAILSPLVKEVYTIEVVESLGKTAARTLKRLAYDNVFTKIGDGFQGWAEHAPFDKIIVTCSPENVPRPLVDQLREGGLMVVPVGERYQQTLYLMRKKDGKLTAEALCPTLFVPMTGTAEAQRRVRPDGSRPQIINGTFEEPVKEGSGVPGWYYERQVRWATDRKAPEGEHYVTMRNQDPGRPATLMQAFPVDGRKVASLEFSLWVKHDNTQRGQTADEVPVAVVSFYDEQRREMGFAAVGPFLGTADWHRSTRTIPVPSQAREGIVRLGLGGATGEISFDDVRLKRVLRGR